MMKIKTSELAGAALDWAVHNARFEGCCIDIDVSPKASGIAARRVVLREAGEVINPSTDSAQGKPIIEREHIALWPDEENGGYFASNQEGRGKDSHGDTYLIAAMRCYVASIHGEEVEVPEELAVVA